jgi:diacylglycerol kinase (ATP)
MKKVGILINPKGGKGKARTDGQLAYDLLKKYGTSAGFVIVDLSRGSATEALKAGRDAVENKEIDALIVAGGDGTISLGFNIVAESDVLFGVIPCGSGNDFAKHYGIPKDKVEEIVKGMILSIENRVFQEIDAGKVAKVNPSGVVKETNSMQLVDDGRNDRYFATIFTGGIDAEISELADKWIIGGSTPGYMAAVMTKIATIRPYGYKVSFTDINGENFELNQPAALIAAAITSCYGGGIQISPNSTGKDGVLTLCVADEFNRREVMSVFPSMYTGGHVDSPFFHFYQTKEVILEEDMSLKSKTGKRVKKTPLTRADGEAVGFFPLKISVVPKAVKLLIV